MCKNSNEKQVDIMKRSFMERRYLWTFASAMFFGVIANIGMFTNKFSFHDDMGALFHVGATVKSGRWLLELLGQWSEDIWGVFSLPVCGGLLSLLLLAASSVIIVDVLEIYSLGNCVLMGGLLVTFPAVFSVFAYMFTAPYYFLAFFMTVMGSYLIIRFRWGGYILGIILIGSAMGIYQAYLPVAVMILLCASIIKTLSEENNPAMEFRRGVRYIMALLFSIILYLAVTRMVCAYTGIQLTDYQGISSIYILDIYSIAKRIGEAYLAWARRLTSLAGVSCSPFAITLYRLFTAALIVIGIRSGWIVWKRNKYSGLLMWFMFVMIPLAANSVYLMGALYVEPRMLYCTAIALLLMLSIGEKQLGASKLYHSFCRYGIAAVMVGFISVYLYCSNFEYFRCEFLQMQTKTYFTTLETRISSLEGYREDMPVVFIGARGISGQLMDNSFYNKKYGVSPYIQTLNGMTNSNTWKAYMNIYCGYIPRTSDSEAYKTLPEIQDMPVYPANGSIRIVDQVVIVKLSAENS